MKSGAVGVNIKQGGCALKFAEEEGGWEECLEEHAGLWSWSSSVWHGIVVIIHVQGYSDPKILKTECSESGPLQDVFQVLFNVG